MAVVKGIREKVHLPLYDAVTFSAPQDSKKPGESEFIRSQISATGNVIKFFVNVQNKTKLETNQQESSVLSHYNTYEARAIRVIIEPPKKSASDTGADTSDTEFLSNFIYNSVTSFIVGEKVMVQAPTWFFPSGAGPANLNGSTNGNPTPEATFRLAEPVNISHQQNFRVEVEFPRGTTSLGDTTGPARVWVMVDGYITRDVQ